MKWPMVARWSAPTTTPPLKVIPTVLVPVFITVWCSDMISSLSRHFLNLGHWRHGARCSPWSANRSTSANTAFKPTTRGVLKKPLLHGRSCAVESGKTRMRVSPLLTRSLQLPTEQPPPRPPYPPCPISTCWKPLKRSWIETLNHHLPLRRLLKVHGNSRCRVRPVRHNHECLRPR